MPGTTDGASPEGYTNHDLSRVRDALDACSRVSLAARTALWRSLSRNLRVQYNYSKWEYVP
jgi:hypothetical protein